MSEIDPEKLNYIRSDGNQVIRRIDRVYDLLESIASSGADPADVEAIEAAQSMLEGAQADVQEMQQNAIDVKGDLEGDD